MTLSRKGLLMFSLVKHRHNGKVNFSMHCYGNMGWYKQAGGKMVHVGDRKYGDRSVVSGS